MPVRVFLGPRGLRSGWRVLIFLLLAFALTVLLGLVTPHSFNYDLHFFPAELQQAIAAAAATWIMARVDRKPFTAYGLTTSRAGLNLLAGLVVGFTGMSLLVGLLAASGVCRFGPPALAGTAALVWALYWAAVFALVGFSEETLSRGYPMYALAEGIGFPPAALIVALLFGLGHLGNGGEQYIGIANAVLAGLVFAYSVYWSGSLWWAIGAHMAWDWAESYFYGTADSGAIVGHHFFSAAPAGPAWLSGGTVGPEGSVLCTAVLVLVGLAVRVTVPRHPPTFGRSETLPAASSPSAYPSTYSAGSDDTN